MTRRKKIKITLPPVRITPAGIVRALQAAHATVAVAESCTGGGLGFALTAVPGSSAVFLGGVISYANRAKHELLGVPTAMLERHGAVSRPVACAMACGARAALHADYGIGITGIAGPGGGSPRKPAGTVWIALAAPLHKTRAICYHYTGSRAQVRRAAIRAALAMLAQALDAR